MLRGPTRVGTPTFPAYEFTSTMKCLKTIAAGLLVSYFLRITIPAVWLNSISPFTVNFSGYFVLAFALIYIALRNLRVDSTVFFLFACLAINIFFSEDIVTAAIKGGAWCLLFAVVGPLFRSHKAQTFRDQLWGLHKHSLMGVTLLSFLWYTSGLPAYGKGISGITMHSMLLGPFAALSLIYSAVKMIRDKSAKYGLIALLSFLTCLVSGSRSAALGALAGVVVIPLFYIRHRAIKWLCIMFLMILAFLVQVTFDFTAMDGAPLFKSGDSFERYVSELQQKGLINTRDEMWEMRWREFYSSPIVGIGIGVDSLDTRTAYGTRVVEPGSSYLSILSMTGIMGALSITILILSIAKKVWQKWDILDFTDRTEVSAAGIFWAFHAIAEGWIFAAGSILCLFFWLWVGRLLNLGSSVIRKGPAA